MDEAKRELVAAWLTKAQHDLATARKAAADPDPILDTAIYHCQQAAEKAIKGFLVHHDHRFPKSHDIRLLVQEAVVYDPEFARWEDAAELLTPLATIYRYPGTVLEPSIDEFKKAEAVANAIVEFVDSRIPSADQGE